MEQEHILNTHIDTLNAWYENAEKGKPRIGDTFIAPYPGGGGYEVGILDGDGLPGGMFDVTRILHRAKNPTPAWHDAVAVIAGPRDDRQVFAPSGSGMWESAEYMFSADELSNPVPLIEAKVTDEMIERGYYAENTTPDGLSGPQYVRRILTAALGLEPA